MAKVNVNQLKRLREETGAPIARVKKVLEKFGEAKALEILKKEGFERAEKRVDRATGQGKIFVYKHHTGKVVGIVELLCETDFVARCEPFEVLGKDLAMQVASMGEVDFEKQEFIKDPSKKVGELIKEVIAKTGENIKLGRVVWMRI